MPVKSKSRTFKPGDSYDSVIEFMDKETFDAIEVKEIWGYNPYSEYIVKKRLVITITYDRDPEKVT